MSGDASLEIGLTWDRHREALWANLRFDTSGTLQDQWGQPDEPVTLDLPRLRRLGGDSEQYGIELARMLLRDDDIGPFYRDAVQTAERNGQALHLRLHITGPPEYHAVRWETLRDPDTGHRIATQSGILMSRYLSGSYWRQVPVREKRQLRGLIAIAGPKGIEDRPNGRALDDVDVDAELDRARAALAGLHDVTELGRGEATLSGLLEGIEEGVDVLYLVCHGALVGDSPVIYLEAPDGSPDRVDGRRLVEIVMSLEHRPTVVMLASCQSASRGDEVWASDDGELSALGPRLVQAGLASVVAMQGDISMKTVETFAPAFFTALDDHGLVDRAMATARLSIENRPDWWAPVLYSRLRTGRTYYKPAFTDRSDETWQELSDQLATGNLLPVLGPGLADEILGSRHDIARRWVKRWQMPLSPHSQGDLAQVAQYLLIRGTDGGIRAQLIKHLDTEIEKKRAKADDDWARHGRDSPWRDLEYAGNAPQLAICEVGRRLREKDELDPYAVAARLPIDVYVTTGWTDLLQNALTEAGRPPVTMSFAWDRRTDPEALNDYVEPTVEHPLVYHLFGRFEQRFSLVLTEDDYFAWYSAWLQRRRKEVPDVVYGAFTERALMFLGFELDDWDFRVIFHGIKSFDGSEARRRNQHAGVQISPENQLMDAEAAQEYLGYRFGADQVNIYWGKTRHFLEELEGRAGVLT